MHNQTHNIKYPIILGIETSCDETAVAIYSKNNGLLAHEIYSQVDLHNKYGGVVPELASRDHIRKLLPLINTTINSANLNKSDISGIAYTKGPGLIGALLVGATLAKTLAYSWNIPTIGIHHLEGHLLAPLLEDTKPSLPFVALLVSGGHTLLVEVQKLGKYKILGESIDDAAGEAFDKTAKLLGLGYPGGAKLAKLATKANVNIKNSEKYKFPRPMLNKPNLDFSFSGLKTAAINTYNKSDKSEQSKADLAYYYQEAIIDTLYNKTKKALAQTNIKNLVIAGGVSANISLRQKLDDLMQSINGKLYLPKIEYCTDNGAMIALAGYLRLNNNQQDQEINYNNLDNNINNNIVLPRWNLTDLTEINNYII